MRKIRLVELSTGLIKRGTASRAAAQATPPLKNKTMTTQQVIQLRDNGFKNFKEETGAWKNLFRGRGYPSSPNVWASSKQRNWIYIKLKELGVDPYEAVFVIPDRDVVREKTLFELDNGAAWNVIQAIKKKKINNYLK